MFYKTKKCELMRGFYSCLSILIVWTVLIAATVFNQGDLVFAGLKTELIIIYFIATFICGSLLSERLSECTEQINPQVLSKLGKRVIIIALFVYFFAIMILLARVQFYALYLDIHLSRVQIYSPDKNLDGPLFSVLYVAVLYLKGVVAVFVYFAFVKYLLDGEKIVPVIISVFIAADALIFNARGPIIELVFLLFVFSILNSNFSPQKLLGLFVFTCPILIIFYLLADGRVSDAVTNGRGYMMIKDLAHYISVGPILLSYAIDFGHNFNGLSEKFENLSIILSGYDYFNSLLLRAAGVPAQTLGYDWIKMLNAPLVIGQAQYQFMVQTTFYTLLAEPYLAFGIGGVICLGFILGASLRTLEYRSFFKRCDFSLFWFIYLFKITLFGIFVSPFTSVIFWLMIIFLLFFSRFIFVKRDA